ncbi:MAG: PD-(D/E)XK nuclease family protein [Actinobacteria bacterium]|nr:PD-(D/E)XK nuclease family protein [Actinomycetota bacterium]
MTKSLRVDVIQPEGASLPPRVSYSQLSKYNQCGLRYYFNYVASWTEPQTSSLVGGNIAHDVIERLYRLPSSASTSDLLSLRYRIASSSSMNASLRESSFTP